MAEFDLGVEEVQAPTNVYDTVQVPSSKNQKKALYVDEATKAIVNGEDMEEAVRGIATKNVPQLEMEGAVRHSERATAVQSSVVEGIAIEQPDLLPEAISNAKTEIKAAGETILASKYDWVDSISAVEGVSREERMSVAINMGLLQVFAKDVDEESVWGLVPDFMGSVFVPDSPYNVAAIKSGMSNEKLSVEEVITSPASISKMNRS